LEKLLNEEISQKQKLQKQVASLVDEVTKIKEWIASPHEIEIESSSSGSDSEERSPKPKNRRRKERKPRKKEPEITIDLDKLGEVIHQGWLRRKSTTDNKWSNRWVELRKGGPVLYFSQPNQFPPLGVIFLENAKIFTHVEHGGKVKPLTFNLKSGNSDFLFEAFNSEEKEKWCQLISANLTRVSLKDEPSSLSFLLEGEETNGAVAEEEEIEMQGWIRKKSGNSHTWQKRYGVLLKGGPLYFFNQPNDKNAIGIIFLQNAKIFTYAEKNGIPRPSCFNIRSTKKDFLLKGKQNKYFNNFCSTF